MQLQLRFENNRQSQEILEANFEMTERQCDKILNLLQAGKKLTVREAMINMGIGDLRRRIKDLRDAGYPIKDELIEGRFKEYYI